MRILAMEYDLKPVPGDAHDDVLRREAGAVWSLQQRSVIREVYLTEAATKAVLLLECDSVEEAKKHLAGLPLVSEGYCDFKLYPLEPYPGFSRLFADG